MTRSARRSARPPVAAVSEAGEAASSGATGNGAVSAANGAGPADSVQVKPGRHREAALYHALHGAGAGDGRTLAQLREAALQAYERLELPVWRRSGFWSTSFQSLDLDALETSVAGAGRPGRRHTHAAGWPAGGSDRAERGRGRALGAGRGTGRARRDPVLAGAGVSRSTQSWCREWYSKRLSIDRHKLEAANAALWTGGAFLYVPRA